MNGRFGGGRSLLAAVAALVGVLAMGVGSASAMTHTVVYNDLASPLPGNYASIGYAATQTSEYGGQVELAGTSRKHAIVTVGMSSWGCQEGSVSADTCATPKAKKKFKWPLTLNVYNVGAGDSVGSKITSITKTFGMPYRPSVSAACATAGDPGAWLDAAAPGAETIEKCFHGLAFSEKFKLGAAVLPSKVIISVAYNTSNYGAAPVGTQACESTTPGCYYDSLNFAIVEPAEVAALGAGFVGADPTESQYVDSGYAEMYCGSSASLNTFAASGACPAWYEGDQPAIKVEATA
jgi:hypothetical protein